MSIQASRWPDGRFHLQHGPIDLIIEAFGSCCEVAAAYRQAESVFQTVLNDLVAELVVLRSAINSKHPELQGPVARRMAAAVWPLREFFITPMAAVAGAVADHVLHALLHERALHKAYVNNGGDIAVYLNASAYFEVGLVSRIETATLAGSGVIHADSPVRGIATSGWRGRSFSLGIADAVTVLAATAALADAAATMIANSVNVEHKGITRQAACELDADSDLGQRLVTVAVEKLDDDVVISALENGLTVAESLRRQGLIHSAVLFLQDHYRLSGGSFDASLRLTPPDSDTKRCTPG